MIKLTSQQQYVYEIMPEDTFTHVKKLQEMTKLNSSRLSAVFTILRRNGLVEYKQLEDGYKSWRKHSMNDPLWPPQADVKPRKRKQALQTNPVFVKDSKSSSVNKIIDQIIDLLIDLQIAVKKECSVFNEDIKKLNKYRKLIQEIEKDVE